ncbi:MAG: esterase/lipase family protein, partial [Pseudonocardiaceae bacterium]
MRGGRLRHPGGQAIGVVLATLGLPAATAVTSPAPGRADTSYPVLLVHGGAGNPGNFKEMERRLVADGYRPFTVNLGFPGVDTARNADMIRTEVDKILATTGASKVHLVGHSMGGLSTRYYIKILNGLPQVATYTAFGTPQHGNPRHTCRPSELVPDQCPRGKVMKELNAGDDTPGSIYYTSIASKQAHPEEANGTWHPLDQGACLPMIDGGSHP